MAGGVDISPEAFKRIFEGSFTYDIPALPMDKAEIEQPDDIRNVGELRVDAGEDTSVVRFFDTEVAFVPFVEEPLSTTTTAATKVTFMAEVFPCTIIPGAVNRWHYDWRRLIPVESSQVYAQPADNAAESEGSLNSMVVGTQWGSVANPSPDFGRAYNIAEMDNTAERGAYCTDLQDDAVLDEWYACLKPIPTGTWATICKDPIAGTSPVQYRFTFEARNGIDFYCCTAPGDCTPCPIQQCDCDVPA